MHAAELVGKGPRSLVLIFACVLGALGPATGPASAQAVLTVHPATAPAGSTVTASGIGFSRGGLVAVWSDFRTASGLQRSTITVHASDTGGLSAHLPVPGATEPGRYTVVANDFAGHRATAPLAVLPGIGLRVGATPAPVLVAPGERLLAFGSGFLSGDTISLVARFPLTSGGTAVVQGLTDAGADGAFTGVTLRVPYAAVPGTVVLRATGLDGRAASARMTVRPHTYISPRPSPARVGASFQVGGAGFPPGSRLTLTILAAGAVRPAYVATAVSGPAGRIAVTVPPAASLPPGAYKIVVTGSGGKVLARSSIVIARSPVLTAEARMVRAGAAVVLRGTFFVPSASVTVVASFPVGGGVRRTVARTVRANTVGGFRIALSVPSSAIGGVAQIRAGSGALTAYVSIHIVPLPERVTVTPGVAAPSASVSVAGAGFPADNSVVVSVTWSLADGTTSDESLSASASGRGVFSIPLEVPANVMPGTYEIRARSASSGKESVVKLTVPALPPAIAVLPRVATPGAPLTVSGFGFPENGQVNVSMAPGASATVSTDANGRFFTSLPVPAATPAGQVTIQAADGSAIASTRVEVARSLTVHAFFPSLYTGVGYHEYIALLNPTEAEARVTIGYVIAGSAEKRVSVTVPAHSRTTRDVNADLGSHVSAAASVTSDQPIAAERLVRHQTDIAIDGGAPRPSSSWYFAAGNTSHGYREYVSVLNPGSSGQDVAFNFMPAHNRPFTLFKSIGPESRLTLNVNLYVPNDAVSVQVTSSRPIVAGRTIFIQRGMSSNTGATASAKTWYFAAGPRQPQAVNWVSVLNPGDSPTPVTLRAYGLHGALIRTINRRIQPLSQIALNVGRLAQHPDVSLVVTAARPVVAEQSSYVGSRHDAMSEVFGLTAAVVADEFAAMGTRTALGESDALDVFNTSATPSWVVLQVMTASGAATQQTYVVPPRARAIIDLGEATPNVQLGAVLVSTQPVVVMNRYITDHGTAGDTSIGIRPPS